MSRSGLCIDFRLCVPSLAAPLVPLPLLLCSIVEKRLKDIFISVEELAGIAQMLREEKALKSTAPEANVTRQELRQQVRKGALPGKLFESSFYSSFRSARGGAGVRTTAGELIVGLGTQSEDALREFVKSWGADIVDGLPEIHAFLVRFDGRAVPSTLYERAALAGFEYVEPNYYVYSTFTPNDPLWSSQWAPHMVHADMAWDIEPGEKSVVVAVIDTGVDYDHEDLAGNYLPIGYDWVNHDPDPTDDSLTGHGTHVAGIIGAVTNNAIGIAGLARVSIMAEKVLNSGGSGTIYDVADDWRSHGTSCQ